MSSLAKYFLTEINIVKAEKIKAKVYVNQDKSLSDLQTMIKHSFKLINNSLANHVNHNMSRAVALNLIKHS